MRNHNDHDVTTTLNATRLRRITSKPDWTKFEILAGIFCGANYKKITNMQIYYIHKYLLLLLLTEGLKTTQRYKQLYYYITERILTFHKKKPRNSQKTTTTKTTTITKKQKVDPIHFFFFIIIFSFWEIFQIGKTPEPPERAATAAAVGEEKRWMPLPKEKN